MDSLSQMITDEALAAGFAAVGFATAIGVALDMIEYGGNQMIAEQIARLDLSEAGGAS